MEAEDIEEETMMVEGEAVEVEQGSVKNEEELWGKEKTVEVEEEAVYLDELRREL